MKLDGIMKGYYRRQISMIRVPAPPPFIEAALPEEARKTPLWLNLAFHCGTAALVILALAGHLAFRSPLVEVFSDVNARYSIGAVAERNLENLRGCLIYRK